MPEDRAHKLRKGGAPMSPHLLVSIRRVIPFGCVAGYVEVIAFLDLGGIFPGVMTGNTVQLGLTFARYRWALRNRMRPPQRP